MPVIINGSTGISGTDGSAGTPAVQGTDTNTGMFFPAADQIAFAEGGIEAMRLDASGNVGIGTAAPGERLQVSGGNFGVLGATGTSFTGIINQNNGASGSAYRGLFYDARNENGVAVANMLVDVNADGSSGWKWSTTPAGSRASDRRVDRFSISAGGTISLNTSFTTVNSKTPLLLAYQTGSGPTISCYVNTTAAVNQITFHNPNGERGAINTDGTSTSYLSASDYRLKENVTPLTDAAARVQALKPCRFNFIVDPNRTVDGFIAHEAAEVVPQAVTGEKDAVNEDGSIKPQGIDQSKLVPLLTAALQEALTEIAALKARVAVLEAR